MDRCTGYLDADSVIYRIIKTQLSTRLGELVDVLVDQTDKCLKPELPPCKGTPSAPCRSDSVILIKTRVDAGRDLPPYLPHRCFDFHPCFYWRRAGRG
jgi:hypothetical protein